jgi:hypothetical protein
LANNYLNSLAGESLMRREVRGQSSIEFLMITGIGLLLITSVSFFFLQQSRSTADTTRLQQATDAGNTILGQALYVYSLGANSWVTVEISIPDDVLAIYTVENRTLVFDVGTRDGMVSQPVFSGVPVAGASLPDAQERRHVNDTTVVHSGRMRFRITSLGDTVQIRAVG